jgi:hypothetical protein
VCDRQVAHRQQIALHLVPAVLPVVEVGPRQADLDAFAAGIIRCLHRRERPQRILRALVRRCGLVVGVAQHQGVTDPP